jgi:serine/threonine protein kinase
MQPTVPPIKVRQNLGKYRIERRLGEGGFAIVYQAMDTIEGVRVALKIPHRRYVTPETLQEFRREVRLAAQLKHPNILPLKNAEFIEGYFVVAFPLGERTLGERMQRRMSLATSLGLAEQMLQAAAYAHCHHIIHCDIKPDNLILFPDHQLKLTDFGIAKVAAKTIRASGSGTVGYIAPEQAMGMPSFRSDVFSLGLILYRMLSGQLPEYPFEWPPPGYERIRKRLEPDLIQLVRRSMDIDPRKRFADAGQMLGALQRVKARALRFGSKRTVAQSKSSTARDWRTMQRRQFIQQYGSSLQTRFACHKCEGPVSECMQYCPWCSVPRPVHLDETSFPQSCPRCRRGMKLDWAFCPWCFGPGFEVQTVRQFSDRRYVAKCGNQKCSRKVLMPFMRYCPWCRAKIRRKWKIPDCADRCGSCGWGVVSTFWSFCPWCGKALLARSK